MLSQVKNDKYDHMQVSLRLYSQLNVLEHMPLLTNLELAFKPLKIYFKNYTNNCIICLFDYSVSYNLLLWI